jgi:hypothetical protein
MYNLFEPRSKDRYYQFMVLAKFAAESGQLGLVYRYIKDVDPKAWHLELEETRALYKRVSEITRDSASPDVRY